MNTLLFVNECHQASIPHPKEKRPTGPLSNGKDYGRFLFFCWCPLRPSLWAGIRWCERICWTWSLPGMRSGYGSGVIGCIQLRFHAIEILQSPNKKMNELFFCINLCPLNPVCLSVKFPSNFPSIYHSQEDESENLENHNPSSKRTNFTEVSAPFNSTSVMFTLLVFWAFHL